MDSANGRELQTDHIRMNDNLIYVARVFQNRAFLLLPLSLIFLYSRSIEISIFNEQ